MPDKFPVKTEPKNPAPAQGGFWSPFESLRTEIDRLFDEVGPSSWRPLARPLAGRTFGASTALIVSPAVDVVEKDDAFEITAEVPGLDEKNIEVKLANSILTIRGEKTEEKEKDKSYHVSERRYGSFQRSFQLPEYVDADKVSAAFAKGILKVTLPKTPNAKKNDRKIEITAG
ncbi:Hsp20/alpha crystallin family protein [Rhizobium mesoamericanum]|uniref:Hsp20/alpha crystallin family protein n=1 Tax=Rhizobium mesoamericanum TaxID=1079800 RepID=UPI00041A1E35|nr:Hsp20/alpha crystallin family protein [Rhizobium mesoamericanum]